MGGVAAGSYPPATPADPYWQVQAIGFAFLDNSSEPAFKDLKLKVKHGLARR